MENNRTIVSFNDAENTERDYMMKVFNQFGITDYKFTPNGSYEQHDGEYTNSKGEKILFEVKVRYKGINEFKTTIIEKSKYDYLLQQELITGKIPYLFAFYPQDNKVFVARVVEGMEEKVNSCQRQTCGDQTKVYKNLVNFKITEQGTITLN